MSGLLERRLYGDDRGAVLVLRSFPTFMDIVYDRDGVTIYRLQGPCYVRWTSPEFGSEICVGRAELRRSAVSPLRQPAPDVPNEQSDYPNGSGSSAVGAGSTYGRSASSLVASYRYLSSAGGISAGDHFSRLKRCWRSSHYPS